MVKGAKLLQEKELEKKTDESETEQNKDDEDEDSDAKQKLESNENQNVISRALPDSVVFRRMGCLAHTLQLHVVIKSVQKGQ